MPNEIILYFGKPREDLEKFKGSDLNIPNFPSIYNAKIKNSSFAIYHFKEKSDMIYEMVYAAKIVHSKELKSALLDNYFNDSKIWAIGEKSEEFECNKSIVWKESIEDALIGIEEYLKRKAADEYINDCSGN